ncbi:MAG TPA: radical SAM protein [Syntrophorhabdus sp.]|mgnify:FL=1|nr:radical SAM protein [Syntrophorhabdus sp.]
MNITLISLDPELYCIGIRILSAGLRNAGHSVQCLFLPLENNKYRVEYTNGLLDTVGSLCGDSGLIGLSLMTNQYLQAINVTTHLKRRGLKGRFIWGGIHPTVEPEACLEYADAVCLGEGERALVELANAMEHGRHFHSIENLWFKSGNELIRNPLRPLIQDLDSIPYPDYSCESHFVAAGGRIQDLTVDKLIQFQGKRYRALGKKIIYPVMTSRGCPFACSYCCNSVYDSLYPGQRRLRWRSVSNVIGELKMIQSKVASIEYVIFVDDNFTARSKKELKIFCDQYRKEIGTPYFAQISPLTISEEKINTLLNSGCVKIVMGIETNNERIASLYNRAQSHRAMPEGVALLEKYRSRMPLPPSYQFIIDNPYETLDDTLETLRFALNLPRSWDNPIYSLMLFPGTPLYKKAQNDGLIKDKKSQIYRKDWLEYSKPFYRIWVRLYRANMFPWLLRILLKPWIARILTKKIVSTVLLQKQFRWIWDADCSGKK